MQPEILPPPANTLRGLGQALTGLAALLWIVALVLLVEAHQQMTYTVCAGSLLQLPPPPVHWPPIGHHTGLAIWQQRSTIGAAGVSILAAFTVLQTERTRGPFARTAWLLVAVGGSLLGAGFLWLAMQYVILTAHLDAFARCL